jgi:Xaa-Pro aminopeptidase
MKPTEREIRSDEIVWIDTGGLYRGYPCDMARAKMLGRPSEKIRRVHGAVLQTNEIVRDAIKPGVKCSFLRGLGVEEMRRHGLQLSLPTVGHGVGRDVHEPPFLTASNDSELAPGMLLTVEIQVRESDVGYMNIEDLVLVTDEGQETLTRFDRGLGIR